MPEESDQQRALRAQIREIRADTTKTPSEIAACIQQLMHQQTPIPIRINNEETECTHYPTKLCSRFKFRCCGGVIDPCVRCHKARGDCTEVDVETILCNLCDLEQPPSTRCIQCNIEFARSYCQKCYIWTDAYIRHCDSCGLCRTLPYPDAPLFHCDTCNSCFSTESHRCSRVEFREASCPVCLESIHDSQKESTVVNCGHIMHTECLAEGIEQNNYRCPTCRKSLFDMTSLWDSTRLMIAIQPIPRGFFPIKIGEIVDSPHGLFFITDIYKCVFNPRVTLCEGYYPTWKFPYGENSVDVGKGIYPSTSLVNKSIREIYCYDCESRCAAEFHFLGMECSSCNGYNTSE